MTDIEIKQVEERIEYTFNDKQLLIDALTHSSYLNEHTGRRVSYDRLEFLGDSILDFIVAEELYFNLNKDEGEMTQLRARIVSREPLAIAVDDMGLLPYMRIGSGARKDAVSSQKTKSDLFESILAAMYIDSGKSLNAPRRFVKDHIKNLLSKQDSKTLLQIYTQRKYNGERPEYKILSGNNNGLDGFEIEVIVHGKPLGRGVAPSKKKAEQIAAEEALKALNINR